MQQKPVSEIPKEEPRNLSVFTISEYLNLILKYRVTIGYIVGATFIISIIISLLLPKMYVATARILPPQKTNSGLSALLSNADDPLNSFSSSFFEQQTPATLYVGIMKSRTVADELAQKFKLKKLYNLKYIEDVHRKLADISTIEVSKKDKIINVSVKDRDPQRAADIANSYIEMLDKTNRRLNITQGKRKRLFLEDRLKEVRSDLEKAELELKAFQEKHHLVAIDEQAKAAIEGAAEIKGQIIAAQTELEILKQFGTEKQVEAVMLKAKIEELQKQLNLIEQGKQSNEGNNEPSKTANESNFYIPFEDLPRLGLQLVRLTRETKIQEKLFELLTSQYEMARIEEAKDVNTIQVLDHAMAPEKKSSPNRRSIVISSVALAMMTSILMIFLIEYTGYHHIINAKRPEILRKIQESISKLISKK